jgi:hypothetical protein
MRNIMVSALIIALVGLSGCGHKATGPAHVAAYFPGEIGSTWVYSVYDSLTSHSYDMTVSVVDSATLRDLPVSVWVYEGDGRIDTQYVYSSGDTITVYSENGWGFDKMYVYPFEVRKGWNCGESCERDYGVDWRGTIETLAARFTNAYHIEGQYSMPNQSEDSEEWFVPGVGQVRFHKYGFCTVCSPMIYVNEVWELRSYHLPN